ncbi:amidohydrolase [Pseudonocardia spinosispora]|uniref:amidohydrolase n=1 Tax=Pseudonocardia spinosispora TaxID=103441 RepID=UPI00048EC614|nr:amidohydrolase [Pseudonocardia spinosispora]
MVQGRDVAIVNGNVRTMDPGGTVARAVLLSGGRIAAVGSEQQVRAVATGDAAVLDVGGRTVVPGFIDNHNHLSVTAFDPLGVDCSTPPLQSIDEVLGAIDMHCRSLPRGQWVMGSGFFHTQVREQRNPTRQELDEVAPHNPFFLRDSSCHAGYANTEALTLAGITAHAPQPWGGEFEKDRGGEPTGILWEAAINRVHEAAWGACIERDWDQSVVLLDAKMREYLSMGITGVGDTLVTTRAAELYRRAAASGSLPLTVQQYHGGDYFYSPPDLRRPDILDRVLAQEGTMLRGGAIKLFVDRFFPDGPAIDEIHDGCVRHVGTPFHSHEEILDLATDAGEHGISTAIHAMGGCAVSACLDAYEEVRRRSRAGAVLRMEHAFVAEPHHAARVARLDVDFVGNPGLGWLWGEVFSGLRQEKQDHLRVLPMRSMIDAGARVSLASDTPCGPVQPALIMHAAVNRTTALGAEFDPEEAITPSEALLGYTRNAAHAAGRASEEGSITVGTRANVLVLDRDILSCPAQEIKDTRVDRTYVDGQLVYERAVE